MEQTNDVSLDPSTVQRIRDVRRRVRQHDARPNDGRCRNVAAALESEFGWERQCGYLKLMDYSVSWVHCWNLLPNGSIVDATADQFQDLWLGDVVTLTRDSPLVSHYRQAPAQWQLCWEVGADGERPTALCVRGDEVQTLSADDHGGSWISLAQTVLENLSGWQLNPAVLDLTARILRAAASTQTDLSVDQLVHPLIIQGIQHLGSRGAAPWIAPEFRDPVR